MITLHPNILEHDGKKTFAVLPYEEFQRVRDELDDYEDLKDLRTAKAKEEGALISPLMAVREELNI
ncbi:MAG: type II toxin-antitoxin system Phd/YefM family antitoxin [Kiritimatiellia bacterium]|nr:type II toxin-antitoxin system Phd/YefM family antitoxin [Kiritimatiellia bacterium]